MFSSGAFFLKLKNKTKHNIVYNYRYSDPKVELLAHL